MTRALWVFVAALPLAAQPPKVLVNAQTDTRSAAQGLEREFRSLLTTQPQPAWIGYSVPAVRNYGTGCDYNDGYGGQRGVVHLEPPTHVIVMFRVEGNAVQRVRTISPYCEIDAGNLPVHWINEVQPAQSVALLSTLVTAPDRTSEIPIGAIAAHSDPSADQALEKFLAPNQPQSLRSRAVSALGGARGRYGFDLLKKLIASDPDERIRERAISAMGSSREADSLDVLVSLAKSDPNPRIRSQAISSLNNKTGPKVLETLVSIAESDADTSVQRRAISTLHSLRDGQGIPALINMAKNARNLEMRKQAMSALKDSRDPRVLAMFEDVLKK
jgi:hypothetical protein